MRFVLMLAAAATVFDACGNANAPPPTSHASALPPCYTDPPQGCIAQCTGDPTQPPTLAWCNGPAAGPRAAQFAADVAAYEAAVEQMYGDGTTLCTANPNQTLTPCGDHGLAPVLTPANQDTTTCMPPAPGCVVGGC